MLFRKPRIGMDINAWCGKCKFERTHVIAAMDGDVVRKVTCSMCNSTHNYKNSPASKSKATSTRGTRSSSKGSGRKSAGFSIDPNQPVKTYSMATTFSEGDVINHPKFGLGSVLTIIPPNKIEVRFEEGTKLLLHATK